MPISLGVAALAAATVAGVSAGVSQAATPSSLSWGTCPKDAGATGMTCATVKVPLDYRKPHGRKIAVEISRLAGKNPAKRRGVLLTNPGGPSSGLGYPALLKKLGMPKSVLDQYDIIGFDPRGIGHSTPVTCDLTPEQQAMGNIPPYANDAADVAKRARDSRQVARQCATSKSAWMLPYVSTANTARDMDRIRAALGRPKMSFAGASWGTHLGAVYTTLFPRHSDRILLDSNMVPGGWKVTAKYSALAARLDQDPVVAPDGRYDGDLFRLITLTQLYGDVQFPTLGKVGKALDAHQPPPPLPGGGEGAAKGADNLISGRYYMICNDSRWPRPAGTYQRTVAADRIRYPMFGAAAANVQPCAYWKKPIESPVRIGDRGPSNVLMVQNQRDPATPLAGARKMRQAFGGRARMVTVDQGGHGVYLTNKNTCANGAVTTFLTTGRRPAHDRACPAEPG